MNWLIKIKNLHRIDKSIYESNPNEIIITEDNYKFRISMKGVEGTIYFKMDATIANAKYLTPNHDQQDADIAIVDLKNKNIFIIEVKSRNKTSKTTDVVCQCMSSEKWLQHIFNILEVEDEFKITYFKCLVNSRRQASSKFHKEICQKSKKQLHIVYGKDILYK